VAAAAVSPSDAAVVVPLENEPSGAAADPSPTVVAATRRAARGRRRKQTVWDRVRSRTQSERRPTVGRKSDRA
jgi:hypothetical protein